ncbi:MAG: 3-oxoadipate enol-lactonase [Labedaea sp.]
MTVTLACTMDGPRDAPVLVLGNSLGTTTAMWEPQLPALARRFRVVRYDHRGHGRSPVPDGPYRLEWLGADLLALLDSLGQRRVHLAGLSLGGMVTMWLAAHAPERVDRIALLCTSALLGPPQMWEQRAETVRTRGVEAISDVMVGRWFTPEFAVTKPDLVDWARKQLTATPAAGYAGCCAAIQTMDLIADLDKITAPALVIAGARDPATPPEHAERIATGIAGARLEIVPDAAHLANIEQPAAVTRLLLEHFGGEQ